MRRRGVWESTNPRRSPPCCHQGDCRRSEAVQCREQGWIWSSIYQQFRIVLPRFLPPSSRSTPLGTFHNRRLLRWAGHVSRMPMYRVPRKLLASWVANPRPVGRPQMTWGRTLNNRAFRAAGVSSTFTTWRDLAAYRDQWRVLCGAKARETAHIPSKHPRDIWAQVTDGPLPSNPAHPATAPARPRRQQLCTPAPTPELTATQKWRAAFMGDRAFTRARAAGQNATEAGRARTKAGADIDFSLPAE